MFRGGGFGRFPMADEPIELLIALLILAALLWLGYRIFTA